MSTEHYAVNRQYMFLAGVPLGGVQNQAYSVNARLCHQFEDVTDSIITQPLAGLYHCTPPATKRFLPGSETLSLFAMSQTGSLRKRLMPTMVNTTESKGKRRRLTVATPDSS